MTINDVRRTAITDQHCPYILWLNENPINRPVGVSGLSSSRGRDVVKSHNDKAKSKSSFSTSESKFKFRDSEVFKSESKYKST